METEVLRSEASFTRGELVDARALAESLVEGLRSEGHECTAPADLGQGEMFDCAVDDDEFSILLGRIDDGVREWVLSTGSKLTYWHRLSRRSDTDNHRKLTAAVHRILKSDPFVADVRWYTSDGWARAREQEWELYP